MVISVMTSIASSSLSGCSIISIIIPRVPLNVSPSISNGAFAKLPLIPDGTPDFAASIVQRPTTSDHLASSSPISSSR